MLVPTDMKVISVPECRITAETNSHLAKRNGRSSTVSSVTDWRSRETTVHTMDPMIAHAGTGIERSCA